MFKGPIVTATIRTSFVLGLRLIVQAGTLLLIARMLGPDQFGAFAGIVALAVLMGTFSTFGTHFVLLGEISRNKGMRQQVLSYAVPTTLISGSLLFLVYLIICFFVFYEITLPFSVIACIGITETMLLPLFVLPVTEQIALEKTARSQLLMVFPLVLRMLAAAGVILLDSEYPLILFAWLYVITALLSLFFMKLYSQHAWLTVKQWRLASKQELKQSAGYAALALTAAGPSEIDKILAAKLLPPGVSGLYAAGSRVIGAAILPVIALLLSAMPKLVRESKENPLQKKHLIDCILISVFLYGFLLAGLFWLAAPLVEWLFGEKYSGIAEMLKWLCLAIPSLAVRKAAGNILIARSTPWSRAVIEFSGLIIMILLSYYLVFLMGSKGLVVAVSLSEMIMSLMMVLRLKKSKVNGG